MGQTVNAITLIATKLASGLVELQFQNPVGGIMFVCTVQSADLTSINTSVNGGSTGATLTLSYPQDQGKGQGNLQHITHSEGN